MATGAPNPAAPSMKAPKQNDQQDLQAAVGGDTGHRFLHSLELASFHRDVVEVDGGEDNPGNFEKAEGDAIDEAHGGKLSGHFEETDGDDDGSQGAGYGAPMRLHFEAGKHP